MPRKPRRATRRARLKSRRGSKPPPPRRTDRAVSESAPAPSRRSRATKEPTRESRLPLVHGQDITALQVELETAGWGADRFAQLCNAIAWAYTWNSGQTSIPAFTERVNVADGGEDARWSREFSADDVPPKRLIRPGLNVFQYKKRTGGPTNRNKVIDRLKRELYGAVAAVEQAADKRIASYVAWINVDATPNQKKSLKAGILNGIGRRSQLAAVEIIGAAEIASMLNDLPHLRSAFFATAAFRDWGAALEAHRLQFAQFAKDGALAPLTGRGEVLGALRQLVEDAAVRAVILTGPHMMGKTRLVLEATGSRDVDFVECLDGGSGITADALSRLQKGEREAIVLVQDVDAETAERMAREALAADGRVKLLITLPTSEGAPAPNFNLDARIQVVPVKPLVDDDARKLFAELFEKARTDYSLESWIVEQAGGVPGILLAAAKVGDQLRPEAGNFIEQVGGAFEEKLRKVLEDDQAMEAMQIASMMTQVRLEGDDGAQVDALCRAFGMEPHIFLAALDRIDSAGFLVRRGSFIEATPPILANRLASRTVRQRQSAVAAAFNALATGGRQRLIRRIAQVRQEHAASFWAALFAPGALLGSLDAVLDNIELFHAAAPGVVARAIEIVHEGLVAMPLKRRRQIRDRARRELVWSLRVMLASPATSERALRALGLLAEAENESIGNNATGEFHDGIYPLNSQMPLGLNRRFAVLSDFLSPERDVSAALIALDAIGHALSGSPAIVMMPSRGAIPMGGFPSGLTWPEVFAYRCSLLDAIGAAVDDARPAVRDRARAIWPSVAQAVAYDGGETPKRAMASFVRIVDEILAGGGGFPIGETFDQIETCRRNLAGFPPDRGPAEAKSMALGLGELLKKLKKASYEVRLKLAVGNSWRDVKDDDEVAPEELLPSKEAAVAALAKEACDAPAKLTPALVEWCLTTEASLAYHFWQELGRNDVGNRWRETGLAIARRDRGWEAAVNFVRGVSGRDTVAARLLFVDIDQDPKAYPLAVVFTSHVFENGDQAAARARDLLLAKRLSRRQVTFLANHPPFQKDVTSAAFADLLRAVAGNRFRHGEFVLHALWFWFVGHPPLAGDPMTELAWKLLEAGVPTSVGNDDYYADEIAARLVRLDSERGFDLLQRTLSRESRTRHGAVRPHLWSPLERTGPRQLCWSALRKANRDRALATVLDRIVAGDLAGQILAMSVHNLVEMPADAEFLRAYAARSEAHAEAVAQAITSRDHGFWELACEILERHPDSNRLKGKLTFAIGQLGLGFHGSFADNQLGIADEIERARDDLSDQCPRTRMWLNELALDFREAAKQERRREDDRWIED